MTVTTCSYCKKTGHSAEECRSRIYNSKQCSKCNKTGHTSKECRSNIRSQVNSVEINEPPPCQPSTSQGNMARI